MPYGVYMSAEGAQVQQQRLEVIANNLANMNTVGFKPDEACFQARLSEAIQRGQALYGDRSDNNVGGGVSMFDTTTDYSAGTLATTGNPLDLAIVGDGFFQVENEVGEVLLTRAGNFSLDSENRLVTTNGLPVLDSAGSEITLDPTLPFEISPAGEIWQNGSSTEIGLVTPNSLGDLVKVGNNLFRPLAPISELDPDYREVRTGLLEMSGTNSTREMMTMIETTRAFEANVRVIQNHDTMSTNLISRVLQR